MTLIRDFAQNIKSDGDLVISGNIGLAETPSDFGTGYALRVGNATKGGSVVLRSHDDGNSGLLQFIHKDGAAAMQFGSSTNTAPSPDEIYGYIYNYNHDFRIQGDNGTHLVVDGNGNSTFFGDITLSDDKSLNFADRTAGYDIIVGNQTTARAMTFAPYSTIGTRYANWDTWIGQNTRPKLGTQSTGVELATNFIAGGASGLNVEFNQLGFYTWSSAELTGLAEGDGLTLGTPKFLVDVSGNATFAGDIVFANGKGLDFSQMTGGGNFTAGTGSSSVLDDYEEGTWTPTLRGSGTPGNYSYSNGYGRYTKVGNLVTLSCSLDNITEVSAGTGYLQITGVPFAKVSSHRPPGSSRVENATNMTGFDYAVSEFVSSSQTDVLYIRVCALGGAGKDLQIADLVSGTTDISLSITYEA